MNRLLAARWLLSALLAVATALSFALDWSSNHLFNPLWHPHARFHGALLLFLLAGVSATGLWLLWRRTNESVAAVRAAAAISLSFWTPLFYIPSVLPGSTPWAGMPGADPRLTGSLVTPNLIVATVFIALTVSAVLLAGPLREPSAPSAAQCVR